MALELTPWDSAEFLHDEQDVALFLAVGLEEDDGPTIYAACIEVAARARGGVNRLAQESGIPPSELDSAIHGTEAQAQPVLQKLAAAYEQFAAARLVA